jgi:hypothetical protein
MADRPSSLTPHGPRHDRVPHRLATTGPWLAFMSGVANRITWAPDVGSAVRACVPGLGCDVRAMRRARRLHPGAPEATMAGKNRKGGSSGSQQTGQGNQQGGQNKGKGSGSKGSR